jgi:hypothetical protein
LEELIKANGEDIEYEFSINGKVFSANQTIFEIMNKCKRDFQASKGKIGFVS